MSLYQTSRSMVMVLMFVASVIGVTILNVFLGMFWYSPMLLGNMWAKSHKFEWFKLKTQPRPTPWHYAGGILVSLITATILAILIYRFQIIAWKDGLLLGILLWLGLIVTSHFSGVIWAQKPLRAYFIDIAYLFISIVMMSTLLTLLLAL